MQGRAAKPPKTSGEKLEKKRQGKQQYSAHLRTKFKGKANSLFEFPLALFILKCKVVGKSLQRPLGRSLRKNTGQAAVLCTPENEI